MPDTVPQRVLPPSAWSERPPESRRRQSSGTAEPPRAQIHQLRQHRPGVRPVVGAPLDVDPLQPLDFRGEPLLYHTSGEQLNRAAVCCGQSQIAPRLAQVKLLSGQKVEQNDGCHIDQHQSSSQTAQR